jgi:hypothetical protein
MDQFTKFAGNAEITVLKGFADLLGSEDEIRRICGVP